MNPFKREQHLEEVHEAQNDFLATVDSDEARALHKFLHHPSQHPDHDHPENEY